MNLTSNNHSSNEDLDNLRPSIDIMLAIFLVLYGIIFVVGGLSNSLVIYSILRRPKLQSVTNIYIFNLACSDFFYLSSIPFLIDIGANKTWRFGTIMCKIYFSATCLNWFNGVFTLTTLSIDRYLAVCRALNSVHCRSNKNAKIVCFGTWCLSAIVMLPIFLYAKELYAEDGMKSCTIDFPSISPTINSYHVFVYYGFSIGYVLPLSCISIFYALVMRRMQQLGPRNSTRMKPGRKNKRRMTMMVSSLITVYIISWTPFWIFQLIFTHQAELTEFQRTLFQFLMVLTYANSALDPLLYAFLNQNFRVLLCLSLERRRSTISETVNTGKLKRLEMHVAAFKIDSTGCRRNPLRNELIQETLRCN